ncbi:hypothetical protein ES703_49390 [subsurface metagenome]
MKLGKTNRSATLVVAASDSMFPTGADYICDGTDDQVEIQAAIDALPATGGEVFLLEGTYYITASTVMPSNSSLIGSGAGTVLKIPDGHNANLDIIINSDTTGGNDHIVVRNLKLDGNKANNTAGEQYGTWFTKVAPSGTTPGCKIVGCFAENFRNCGIYIEYSKNSIISGNHCSNNGLAGHYEGICLYECSNNTIAGNLCQGNEGEGIYIYSTSLNNTISGNTCLGNNNGIGLDVSTDNNTIAGNTCQGNSVSGIYIRASSGNAIAGNTCQGNSYHGICLDASLNNTATGNTCLGNGYQGILINSSSDNTISGNTCMGNTYNGINLAESSEYNTISGNTCSRNNESGICLHTSSNNTISGNLCQGNGRYGIVFVTASNNTISGNTLVENSQNDDIHDDNINLQTNSNYNLFTGNVCRKASVSTTLTGDHNIGVTTITLASTAGFRAGGGITFNPGGANEETKVVATITDATHLTITLGLTNDHINAETVIVPRTRYGIYIWDANCIKNLLIGNDLYDAGSTANLNDGGTLTIVQDDNRDITQVQVKHLIYVQNTSGGNLLTGNVVKYNAAAGSVGFTTPTAVGEDGVWGMLVEDIDNNAYGYIQVLGGTTLLDATNVVGGNIVIGDFLCTENGVRAQKAAAGDMAFAIALEDCAVADAVIDALIITPRKL